MCVLRSLRVAVVSAFIIVIFFFAVFFLFVLFFVWFFSEEDIGSYRSIRVWDDAFGTDSMHAQMVRLGSAIGPPHCLGGELNPQGRSMSVMGICRQLTNGK